MKLWRNLIRPEKHPQTPLRNINLDKKELTDYTFRRRNPPPHSFADLGGVWNVDGVYTFYTLSEYGANRA